MSYSKRLLAAAISCALAPATAFATNGMNMPGYGPIAGGVGGASFAYDNGTAGVMNNPATLGLMPEGNRIDAAVAELRPDVQSSFGSEDWNSGGDSYLMPAFGWMQHRGKFTYGAGMFAQGGMGTEYKRAPGAAMTAMGMMAGGAGQDATMTAYGWEERSEVGVGRLIFPLAYNVDDQLTIGGSLDMVWATMDLKMAMPGQMMQDMMPGGSQQLGIINGSMVDALMGQMQSGNITGLWGGYFDFSDNSDFWGETSATGFAGKLGVVYRINSNFSVGATYHSITDLGDLDGDATVSMAVETPAGTAVMPVKGKISIRDFQWPETYGIGMAYQTDRLMFALDVKQINWSDVMDKFTMSFTAKEGGFAGTNMNATLKQNWDDQVVVMTGVAYRATDALTLRVGANIADNPVPNSTVNYLFPAITEEHYTVGFGYAFSAQSDVNFSYAYAPEVKVSTPQGLDISHEQSFWQLMYSYSF